MTDSITERINQAEQKAEDYRLQLAEALRQGQEWKDRFLDYKERWSEAVKLSQELNEEIKLNQIAQTNNKTYAAYLASGR